MTHVGAQLEMLKEQDMTEHFGSSLSQGDWKST